MQEVEEVLAWLVADFRDAEQVFDETAAAGDFGAEAEVFPAISVRLGNP